MSARTLAWSELTGPHLSRHLADRQAETDWAKFRPGPEPTWEEVREAWMAGGGEHRRDVATPEGVLRTNCACESVRAAAEVAANANGNWVKLCTVDCFSEITILSCAPDDNSGANCDCEWSCQGHHPHIDGNGATSVCAQVNHVYVDPCPPMWSDEYESYSWGSAGSGWANPGIWATSATGGSRPLGPCEVYNSEDCWVLLGPQSSRPTFPALPSSVDVQCWDPDTMQSIASDEKICGFMASEIIDVIEFAYRILLANSDIIAYVLCTYIDPNGAATPNVTMDDVQTCLTEMFVLRTKGATIAARSSGHCPNELPTSAQVSAQVGYTESGIIHIFMGFDNSGRVMPLQAAVSTGGLGVSDEKLALACLILHEAVHLCNYKHPDPLQTCDLAYTIDVVTLELLRLRYRVGPFSVFRWPVP